MPNNNLSLRQTETSQKVVGSRYKAQDHQQTQSRWNGKTVSIHVARTVLKGGAVLLACFFSPIIAVASIPYIIAKSISNSDRRKKHYEDITTPADKSPPPSSKDVPAALKKQAEFCIEQQNAEKDKTFVYKKASQDHANRTAPSEWTASVEEKEISGMPIGIASAQGRRSDMEDAHLAIEFNLSIGNKILPVRLFGVFDGHGGNEAAMHVKHNLQQKLSEALVEFNPNGLTDEGIWRALKETMKRLDSDFKREQRIGENGVGTTATLAMILDDKLWTANVGDSRTILDNAGKPQQLTEDAKPDNDHYAKGIEKRNGTIYRPTNPNDPSRVGSLSIARAIGQYKVEYQDRGRFITQDTAKGVIPNPKITMKPLSDIALDSHLILCCDEIFDVASTRQVVGGVHSNRGLTPKEHAENIIYSAYQANSKDNLSAIVIKLKPSDLDGEYRHDAGFIRYIQSGGDYEILERYGQDLISTRIHEKGNDYDENTDEYVKNIKTNLGIAKELARIEHDDPRDVRSSALPTMSDSHFIRLLEEDIRDIPSEERKYIEKVQLTEKNGEEVKLPDLGCVRYILNGGDFEELLRVADTMGDNYSKIQSGNNEYDLQLQTRNITRLLNNLQYAKLATMETFARRHQEDPFYTEEQKKSDIDKTENRYSEFKEDLMKRAS